MFRDVQPIFRLLAAPGKTCLLAVALLSSMLRPARAVQATADEMADARRWIAAHLEGTAAAKSAERPFSFLCGGTPSSQVITGWELKQDVQKLDDIRIRRTLTYTDRKTGLVARCVAVEYLDFPTVEWTLYLKNTSEKASPIVSDLRAVETTFQRGLGSEFVLYHHVGSPAAANDYQPLETPLPAKSSLRITTSGGRPTNSNMPYFNIAWGGRGAIVVLGWPGQWAAQFTRNETDTLTVQGGQELTRFKLLPGEEVRTPLAVIQFWRGDRVRAQNIWRRWMIAHNLPRPGSKPMPTATMMCVSDFYPGMKSNARDELKYVDAYVNAGVKLDYWWIDAGWYPCGDGWGNVGTWQPDPQRYPKGLKEVSDYVHARNMKLVVWFEPERVAKGRWLAENHPAWVLGGTSGGLLNLGDPQARQWLTDHVDKLLVEQGIDLYRQDFNMDPLGYWRNNDPPDRQGITEIRHVEGYLAYWDELHRRHPGMPIDTCASGGRRNDLETLRRAFPLLRSDYRFEPVGTQGHTYGIASWIPYYGTGVGDRSDYVVRSHWCPWLGIGRQDPRRAGLDWTDYHRKLREFRKVAGCFLGDYYPLTSYSLADDVWMAWQFDCPERGEGLVQAFRRDKSPCESVRFKLRGLDLEGAYEVTDLDRGATTRASGRELLEKGLRIDIANRPAAAVLTYQRAAQAPGTGR